MKQKALTLEERVKANIKSLPSSFYYARMCFVSIFSQEDFASALLLFNLFKQEVKQHTTHARGGMEDTSEACLSGPMRSLICFK